MEFFPELEVSAIEAEAIARGLYAVALVDGLHERELALIADFYGGTHPEGRPELVGAASLQRLGPLDPASLAAALPAGPHRELFVKTAYLLAWADGEVSSGERASIDAFASGLEIAAEVRKRLESEVKDYLLHPFASLANVEGAAAVAKKLKL
jgi:tellurite resistance protein